MVSRLCTVSSGVFPPSVNLLRGRELQILAWVCPDVSPGPPSACPQAQCLVARFQTLAQEGGVVVRVCGI